MPDFLALDWEHRQVCGLDAEVSHGGVRVRQAFSLEWPEGKSPDVDVPAAASWLTEQFASLGLTAKSVLVTLPREDAVVRVLEVPHVPDAELPNVVKFQAAAKSARQLDTLLLDFLPLPPRAGVAGREVLVATIGREVLDGLKLILSRAGCELAGVSLTAPAMVELIARLEKSDPPPKQAVELAIVSHEQRVEISLLRDRALLLTHAARLPDDATTPDREQQAIVAEVNRSLVALKRQHPESTLSRTWLWGDPTQWHGLAAVLRKRFGCDVNVEDPLVLPGLTFEAGGEIASHALFTGPVGLLFGQAGRLAESLDFLHPRQPVVPRDLRRLWGTVGATAAAALLLGTFGWRWYKVSSLESDAVEFNTLAKELKTELDGVKKQERDADSLARWADQRVSWLIRLNELAEATQGTERRYLTKLNCTTGGAGLVGVIKGTGFAKKREDYEELTQRLLAKDEITVSPHPIVPGGPDGDYPIQFELDVSWRPVKKGVAGAGQGSGAKTQGAPKTK